MKTTKLLLILMCVFSLQLSAQKINQENNEGVSLEKLIQQKSTNYVITNEHISSTSGIRHVYLRQAINGMEVYGTESSVHFDKAGTVIATHNNFLENIQATVKSSSQSLSASQAINGVSRQMGYTVENLQQLSSEGGIQKKALFNKAGISLEEIPVKLMYYFDEEKGTNLVWELSIAELHSSDWWNFRVDASTGMILDKNNWTVECALEHNHNEDVLTLDYNANLIDLSKNTESTTNSFMACVECYEVFAMPLESPYYGSRTTVIGPANSTASPYGWHDTDGAAGAEHTVTKGNNVDAFEFDDNSGYQTDGGVDLEFTGYAFGQDYSNANQYEDAAITNLFYWNNIVHDVLYQYGFTEIAGNFQDNNYGNGGLGGDFVNARAQDGTDTCNARFATPVDGSNPTMKMYLCGDKDGDFDNLVILHEFAHGISNRLTGGAADSDCLDNSEQMGEGWSDFYGYILTMNSSETGTDARGVGTYLFDQGANGAGIRNFMYSTDMTVNPHTYDDIKTTGTSPHALGEVWATMLWDLTWGLIDEYGFDSDFYSGTGGNNIALTLVTEGLKLQGCSPGFVDGRDAILAADVAIYGGVNACIIWNAFARRGLGLSADQGLSTSRTDGTEAFDSPFDAPEAVCVAPFSIPLDVNGEVNLSVGDIDDGSSVSCGSYSLSISPDYFDCDDLGDNVVTLTLTDLYGDETTCTTTVTVEKHPTTLTYTGDLEEQYSDETNLSAVLVDAGGTGLVGKTILFEIGSQSTSAVTNASGIASTTLIITQSPVPAYTVDVEFVEDDCYAGSTDSDVYDITPEDAIVEYTGHLFQATAPNSDEAVVVLSANIQDITVTNPDPLAGDIRDATVQFVDRDGGAISPPIPVVDLFDPSDPTTGTVSYAWNVDLGNLTSKSYTVGIVVGNYYTRNDPADDVVVTIYKPVGDFITGGGYFMPDNSAGQYASTTGLKANFGFNVKYNRKGKKLKGHMNIIIRRLEGDGVHTYQIKGNAIQSLGVNVADEDNKFGEFITKSNLTDVTDPDNPISIAGNLSLKVDLTDRGEPGENDEIGVNLTNSSGILLYSSNWSGLNTEQMFLSGGNLVIHSGFNVDALLGEVDKLNSVGLAMYPNPASNKVVLDNPQKVDLNTVSIYDLSGRLVQVVYLNNLETETETEIDISNLKAAVYMVIIQNDQEQITKQLIKE